MEDSRAARCAVQPVELRHSHHTPVEQGKTRLMRFGASSSMVPIARVQALSSVFSSNDAILEVLLSTL